MSRAARLRRMARATDVLGWEVSLNAAAHWLAEDDPRKALKALGFAPDEIPLMQRAYANAIVLSYEAERIYR